MAKTKTQAIAYSRTSSSTNIAGDSRPRQEAAIAEYAKHADFEIVDRFYDGAVSGEDHLESRPGFSAMLDIIEGNGVRTVLIESADRLARSVMVQETGILALRARGVTVITASGHNLTDDDDPAKVAMRQMAAVFAQFEKARVVAKLRSGRDRKSAAIGRRCEGRKPVPNEVLQAAKRLARRNPKNHQHRSFLRISRDLGGLGYFGPSGNPYPASSIKLMLQNAGVDLTPWHCPGRMKAGRKKLTRKASDQ